MLAVIIISISIYYTNHLVKRFAAQESKQIEMWAEAVQSHAELMNYTKVFFNEVSEQEQKRVQLLARAYESFPRQSHKLRPTGPCLARRGGRSIAGENPEPEINLESSRKRKTSKMAREQRACGEGRAGSIRGWKDPVHPGMVGRTPWGTFQGQ